MADILNVTDEIQITEFPKKVQTDALFHVKGRSPARHAGASIQVLVDRRFDFGVGKVGPDGTFSFDFRLRKPGTRTFEVQIGDLVGGFMVQAVPAVPIAAAPDGPGRPVELHGSVGRNAQNKPEDVQRVRERLKELGYLESAGTRIDQNMIMAIRLFQSAIFGMFTLGGDGRIDVEQQTHAFLEANNAPRWQKMPVNAPGFFNFDRGEQRGGHDFGTSWLAQTVLAAATDYQKTYRDTHANAAKLVINDLSLPHGGDTRSHEGHETGMEADVLLPRIGGDFGGITFRDRSYDRQAARAILKSLHRQPGFLNAFFNDPALMSEGLCGFAFGHDNHIHVRIRSEKPN